MRSNVAGPCDNIRAASLPRDGLRSMSGPQRESPGRLTYRDQPGLAQEHSHQLTTHSYQP